jgi:hypothetical protein
MFFIEEQVKGDRVVCRSPGTKDNAEKALAAMRLCDPSRVLRVAEYGRVVTKSFAVERLFPCGTWMPWRCGFESLEQATEEADLLTRTTLEKLREFRVVVHHWGKSVVAKAGV